jgi:hypothetical protein
VTGPKRPSPDQKYLIENGWTRTREEQKGNRKRVFWTSAEGQEHDQQVALYVQAKRDRRTREGR